MRDRNPAGVLSLAVAPSADVFAMNAELRTTSRVA
jgi:hypothetical protein